MKIKFYMIVLVLCMCRIVVAAQISNDTVAAAKKPLKAATVKADSHKAYYLIGDDPNISYQTSMTKYETILFQANPIVRYSFFNNIYKLVESENSAYSVHEHVQAIYFSYRPELRMYTNNSDPVKTPSYRILVGTQQVWRGYNKIYSREERRENPRRSARADLFGFSVESGHYSNGQDGGAFTTNYADGSPQSEAAYNSITPQSDLSAMLNRESGNFSTDLTEVVFNYRINYLDGSFDPVTTHSFKIGGTVYHNYFLGILPFGGYTENDLELMGRFRSDASYEVIHTIPKCGWRYAVSESFEVIYNAHPSVQPLRSVTTVTVYPFHKMTDFGFFVSATFGHDDYNYRFVDSGHQFGAGISWSLFPPFAIKGFDHHQ